MVSFYLISHELLQLQTLFCAQKLRLFKGFLTVYSLLCFGVCKRFYHHFSAWKCFELLFNIHFETIRFSFISGEPFKIQSWVLAQMMPLGKDYLWIFAWETIRFWKNYSFLHILGTVKATELILCSRDSAFYALSNDIFGF